MMLSDGRGGSKRLNKIAERAQLDDEDLALAGWPQARHELRPERRQSVEINEFRQFLKSFEYRRVLFQLDSVDAREQALDEPARRDNRWGVTTIEPRLHGRRKLGG